MQEITDKSEQISEAPEYDLFSIKQIIAATFFGGVVGGGLILAWNYTNLGKDKLASRCVLFSVFVLVSQIIINVFLIAGSSDEVANFVSVLFLGGTIGSIGFVANYLQGNIFREHQARNGKQGSNLNIATICLFVNFIFLLLFSVSVMLSN